MPTYGKWATAAGGAGITQAMESADNPQAKIGQGQWVPGGENWSAAGWTAPAGALSDTPVYNTALGMFVSSKTGKPFTGKHPDSGQTYLNGQPTGVPVPYGGGRTINPNNPAERYAAVNLPKNPEINPVIQSLTENLTKSANDAILDFNQYKKEYQDALGAAKAKSEAATSTQPIEAALTGELDRYRAALANASRAYSDVNQRTAANEQALVQEARGLLPSYDTAAQRAADLAMAALQQNVSRYKAASGTPMSLGSTESQILQRGAANILVPMEQAKIAQRYNILNSLAMPTVLDIANRETAKAANFDPMIAAQEFAAGTQTPQTIQQLRMITSNMAYNDAVRFMQSIGVPAQLQQSILASTIGNAGALNQLLSSSRYQGLQDILGAYITPSIGTTFVAPGYPSPSRYGPQTSYTGSTGATYGEPLRAANAPQTVAPAAASGDWVWDANNQRWQNWKTGEIFGGPRQNRYVQPTAATSYGSVGSPLG